MYACEQLVLPNHRWTTWSKPLEYRMWRYCLFPTDISPQVGICPIRLWMCCLGLLPRKTQFASSLESQLMPRLAFGGSCCSLRASILKARAGVLLGAGALSWRFAAVYSNMHLQSTSQMSSRDLGISSHKIVKHENSWFWYIKSTPLSFFIKKKMVCLWKLSCCVVHCCSISYPRDSFGILNLLSSFFKRSFLSS